MKKANILKLFSSIGLLVIIGGCLILPVEAAVKKGVVTFADSNLEAAIREAIDKPEGNIKASDLANLTHLEPGGRGISDLSGIECCAELKGLYIWDNQISDISPLVNLTSLEGLEFGNNQISDISPLADLTSLEHLGLGANEIRDISALENLTYLEHLALGGNKIRDISVLANLTYLESLSLGDNKIRDISVLLTIHEAGGLQGEGSRVDISYNNMDLKPGSNNRNVVDTLIEAGVEVRYEDGNIID